MSSIVDYRIFFIVGLYFAYEHGMLPSLWKSVGVGTLGIVGMLVWKQSSLLYMPWPSADLPKKHALNPAGYRSPDEYGFGYKDLLIPTADGVQIHSWFIYNKSDRTQSGSSPMEPKDYPTLLYFHGNAGSIAHRLPVLDILMRNVPVNVLAVDYRGYGQSQGTPSEKGLMLDAEAALKWARNSPELVDPNRIFVFGRSLGGAVSIHLAEEEERKIREREQLTGTAEEDLPPRIRGLIVENTFTSVRDVAIVLLPFLKAVYAFLVPPVLTNIWPNIDRIHRIKAPMLLLSSELDEIIPSAHMHSLHQRTKSEGVSNHVTFVEIPGAGHNDAPIKGGDDYYEHIKKFINAHDSDTVSHLDSSDEGGSDHQSEDKDGKEEEGECKDDDGAQQQPGVPVNRGNL